MNPIDVDAWFAAYGMTKPDNTDNTAIEAPLVVSNVNTTAVPEFKMCPLIVADSSAPTESDYDSDTVNSTYFSD